LPAGWVWTSLGELLTSIETGKSFKCDERPPSVDEVGVIKVSAVTWGEYREQESKTCTDPDRVNPSLFVRPGDFLFSRANTIELVGACVIARQVGLSSMLSDKILRFCFALDSMKPWVLHFLRSKAGRQQIESLASGNQESMRNIGQERIGQIRLPLPPTTEQTRIVAKLDELLSGLDAGVAELKAAQQKLQRYRQSLLKAAVEGALTADWRRQHPPTETGADLLARILRERRSRWEHQQLAHYTAQQKPPPKGWQDKYPEPQAPKTTDLPELPDGWVWASVEQLGVVQLGRQRSPDKLRGVSPIRYIRAANITERGIDLSDVLEMDFSESEIETFSLIPGDVLLTEASGSPEHVGRPAIWTEGSGVYCFQNTVLRFRSSWLGPRFAYVSFLAMQKLGLFQKVAGGIGINHLSAGKFSSMPFALPPLSEQVQIADLLEETMVSADSQDQAINRALKQSAAQRQNLLRAAFRGELVPQDPADEPASLLLARLRAERAAAPTRGTRKHRSTA
jgi:type I restriction enzyme S subunit